MTTPSKSAVSQDLILAARQGLIPVSDSSWLVGFGNMLSKELGQWWGTRSGWVQILLWLLLLNGVSTIVILTEGATPAERMEAAVMTFLPMSVGLIGIATVISMQGAIVGEKELGTAAWVMSKPASRSAFVLAKALASLIGFGISAIAIPTAVFILITRLLIPATLPFPSFLAGVGLVALNQLFYLMLTLMLGTIFSSRSPIAAIGIGLILTGLLLKSFIPQQVMLFTPWPLPEVAGGLAVGSELPSVWWVPVAATAGWIVVMTVVALLRFRREEF